MSKDKRYIPDHLIARPVEPVDNIRYTSIDNPQERLEAANRIVQNLELKGQVSDGYHTFDELYEHRYRLFIAYLNTLEEWRQQEFSHVKTIPYWKSRINSEGESYEGYFVAGIEDKITYHLPNRLWDKTLVPEIPNGRWDGHTPQDILERLI